MYYKVDDIKINIDELIKTRPREAIIRKLNLKEEQVKDFSVLRRSQDSRFHNSAGIFHVFSVYFDYPQKLSGKFKPYSKEKEAEQIVPISPEKCKAVIVGSGPAGLFSALRLLDHGIAPIIVERGKDLPQRSADVRRFWDERILNSESNVQFGLGGAGTFSDGKLMSRIKSDRTKYVAEKLVEFGADETILYGSKPHIGTDKLRKIVADVKCSIEERGGVFLFKSKMTDVLIRNERIEGIIINDKDMLPCTDLILALGNSARDTFEMLHKKGVAVISKPFAVGVRVEHPQEVIDRYTYGKYVGHPVLNSAEYQLTFHDSESGRAVYSFCNCPGGLVINASSETGGIAVNGMSFSKRNSKTANAAIVVTVGPEDFKSASPLAGMEFQRELEQNAYIAGGSNYNAPVMRITDFLERNNTEPCSPTIKPGTEFVNIESCLPPFITLSLKNALNAFCRQIEGFDCGIMTAPETRTSSPIRILRSADTMQSVNVEGVYPVGEGAGYAGGIMSSAVDGVKSVEQLVIKYKNL